MIRPALFMLSVLPVTACLAGRDGAINLERDSSASDTKDTEQSDLDASNPTTGDALALADAAADAAVPPAMDADASPTSSADHEDHDDDDTSTAGETSDPSNDDQLTGDATSAVGSASEGDSGSQTPGVVSEWAPAQTCIYHTAPVPFPAETAGDAGADGGPPAGPHVTLLDSEYLGTYLADHAGYTLYIYTADLPGNCNTPPVSTCFDDCLIAWPIFEAYDRVLAEGLDG